MTLFTLSNLNTAAAILPCPGAHAIRSISCRPVNWIVGNVSAPYQSNIIKQYAFAADYYAVAHPSHPNYIALISGTINGGFGDCGAVIGPGCVISNSTNILVNLRRSKNLKMFHLFRNKPSLFGNMYCLGKTFFCIAG